MVVCYTLKLHISHNTAQCLTCHNKLANISITLHKTRESSESVQWAITGPCLCIRHRPSAQRTVAIRKICQKLVPVQNTIPYTLVMEVRLIQPRLVSKCTHIKSCTHHT